MNNAKGVHEVLHGHKRTAKWKRKERYLCLLLLNFNFTVSIDREWRLRGECIETTPKI